MTLHPRARRVNVAQLFRRIGDRSNFAGLCPYLHWHFPLRDVYHGTEDNLLPIVQQGGGCLRPTASEHFNRKRTSVIF